MTHYSRTPAGLGNGHPPWGPEGGLWWRKNGEWTPNIQGPWYAGYPFYAPPPSGELFAVTVPSPSDLTARQQAQQALQLSQQAVEAAQQSATVEPWYLRKAVLGLPWWAVLTVGAFILWPRLIFLKENRRRKSNGKAEVRSETAKRARDRKRYDQLRALQPGDALDVRIRKTPEKWLRLTLTSSPYLWDNFLVVDAFAAGEPPEQWPLGYVVGGVPIRGFDHPVRVPRR